MFRKMTIGKKITLGFSVLVVLAIIAGLTGYLKASQVYTNVSDLENTHVPLSLVLGELEERSGQQELNGCLFEVHGEEQFVEEFHKEEDLVD